MTQNAQPWISLWKGAEGSCDRVTGLLKCWVKFKVAKWEILHVVGDTALTLQVSKPSSDIAQTSNKQVRNFCLSCSQSRARREKKKMVCNLCNLQVFSCQVGYWFRCWTPSTKSYLASSFPISSEAFCAFISLINCHLDQHREVTLSTAQNHLSFF